MVRWFHGAAQRSTFLRTRSITAVASSRGFAVMKLTPARRFSDCPNTSIVYLLLPKPTVWRFLIPEMNWQMPFVRRFVLTGLQVVMYVHSAFMAVQVWRCIRATVRSKSLFSHGRGAPILVKTAWNEAYEL